MKASTRWFSYGVYIVAVLISVALLMLAQSIMKTQFQPGEFIAMEALLSGATFFLVPMFALSTTISILFRELQEKDDEAGMTRLVDCHDTLVGWFCGVWMLLSMFIIMALDSIFSTRTVMIVATAGLVVCAQPAFASGMFCLFRRKLLLWAGLVVIGSAVHLWLVNGLVHTSPYAELGLLSLALGNLVLCIPLNSDSEEAVRLEKQRRRAARQIASSWNFWRALLAGLCVYGGIFAFIQMDVIPSPSWQWQSGAGGGTYSTTTLDSIDNYLAAGLWMRALLCLGLFGLSGIFTHRLMLDEAKGRTVALLGGYCVLMTAAATVLIMFRATIITWFFGTESVDGQSDLYSFGAAAIPLAYFFAFAIYFLASRWYPGCWLIGALGIVYSVWTLTKSSGPEFASVYLFEAALISLLIAFCFSIGQNVLALFLPEPAETTPRKKGVLPSGRTETAALATSETESTEKAVATPVPEVVADVKPAVASTPVVEPKPAVVEKPLAAPAIAPVVVEKEIAAQVVQAPTVEERPAPVTVAPVIEEKPVVTPPAVEEKPPVVHAIPVSVVEDKPPVRTMPVNDLPQVTKEIPVTVVMDDRKAEPTVEESAPRSARPPIGVVSKPVEYQPISMMISVTGRVQVDETALREINVRAGEGFIDRLYANFKGKAVQKGEPLLRILCEDWATAQESYIKAYRSWRKKNMTRTGKPDGNPPSILRERLRIWDVTPSQIAELEALANDEDIDLDDGLPQSLEIVAPFDGYVVEKKAVEGARFEAGQALLTLANLDQVWIVADFPEDRARYINVGVELQVRVPSLPKYFAICPVRYLEPVDESDERKGLRVRLVMNNEKRELSPGVFTQLSCEVSLGDCLVVPSGAVMPMAGKLMVFVEREGGQLETRQVEVGVQSGDYYQILSGVREGQKVVIGANFLLGDGAGPQ